MQAASRLIEPVRRFGPATWLVVGSLAALVFAYSSLLTLGTQFGFEKTVEYWLFRPTDNAPAAIIGLSAWLFYRRWYRLRALPRATASPVWIGGLVLTAVVVHVWAVYTRADDLKFVSLVLGSSGVVLAFWSGAGLRAVWLPILFLLFAVPIPAPLLLAVVFKLQIWTATFAGALLYLLGIPALVSGDQIVRVAQTFQVVEGCSGIRSIATLTMLTILLIDLFGRRGWHAVVLLVVAPFVAFGLNAVRVLTMILNPHSDIVAIHNLQGIVILIVGLLLVYGLDSLIERIAGDRLPGPWRPPERAGSRAFSPIIAYGALLGLAVATAASALWSPIWEEGRPAPRVLHDIVDQQLGSWPSEKADPEYAFRGSTRYRERLHRHYTPDDGPVSVFIGTADLGQRGGSMISPITALPGSGWLMRESGWTELPGVDHPVDTHVLEKGKQRVLVYHWYAGRRSFAVETWRCLAAIDRSALRRPEIPYVVRLEAPILGHRDADRADATARLERLYTLLRPVFDQLDSVGRSDARGGGRVD